LNKKFRAGNELETLRGMKPEYQNRDGGKTLKPKDS